MSKNQPYPAILFDKSLFWYVYNTLANISKKSSLQETKMIESDGMTYEMWKMGKGVFKYLFLGWLIITPIIVIFLGDISWNFFLTYIIVLIIFQLFRLTRKNISSNFYLAKMNEEIIILKRDGEESINLNWNEVSSLSRLRFTNPALYIMTIEAQKNVEYIFPTSAHLLTFSISINGIGIQRDFSKMGKHIRKMKKLKNLKSFYFHYANNVIQNIKKTFANNV
ncbi:hypothetical protein [Namhaeicola litoreus]|uniref:YcxB-like protein domain-containing protein n=1 Tax=Namhaeicola litoreus TaxID=1052145 RepID=A0ABW3Y6N9_9FLAO